MGISTWNRLPGERSAGSRIMYLYIGSELAARDVWTEGLVNGSECLQSTEREIGPVEITCVRFVRGLGVTVSTKSTALLAKQIKQILEDLFTYIRRNAI